MFELIPTVRFLALTAGDLRKGV